MTLELCASFCSGSLYFGTEYGRECYCGNTFASGSVPAPPSDCYFTCPGDGNEFCGAGNRLSVYMLNTTAQPLPPSPAIKPVIGKYKYNGCITDSGPRALIGKSSTDDKMTLEMCAGSCAGFKYFGVEYGRECYCGDAFNAAAGSVAAPGGDGDCSFLCPGDQLEFCGAGWRMSSYVLA